MKKIILICALFISSFSFSQLREKGDIEIFPTVGANSSTVTNSDLFSFTSARSGIRFGVSSDYYFNNRWSLRSGILFSGMGHETILSESELSYINVPINANWHFGSTRKWNLNFGLTPGFLVKAESNGTDISNTTQSFQLGISYGIGYKLEISKNFSLMFDAQAFAGLTDVNDNLIGSQQRNIASSLNIGAVFKL